MESPDILFVSLKNGLPFFFSFLVYKFFWANFEWWSFGGVSACSAFLPVILYMDRILS